MVSRIPLRSGKEQKLPTPLRVASTRCPSTRSCCVLYVLGTTALAVFISGVRLPSVGEPITVKFAVDFLDEIVEVRFLSWA